MEDDSSNDVIAMDCEECEPSSTSTVAVHNTALADRPLMQFFKRLIYNKHSQNTMLTNAQLEDILDKEFDFNLLSLHLLEVEIYVTILKKYLKEWPMWDEFEIITKKELPEQYEPKTFVNIVEKRYKNLKTYLKANLDMAKELSASIIAKVKESEKGRGKTQSDEPKSADPSGVVLEIAATRDQLNKLIYRQPHKGFNCTIFNVEDKTPSHIRMNTLSLDAILNWWSVRITISLQTNNVFLTRETTHELQHLLVNRQGRGVDTTAYPVVELNEAIQIKDTKKAKQVPKKQITGCLNLLSTKHDAEMEGMERIIQCVKKGFLAMHTIAAPAQYRRYLNKYPYVRYLYTEAESVNEIDRASYDIQLKETILPMHQFSIGRLDLTENKLPPQWLKVECLKCNVTCTGEDLATQLRQHFDENHDMESDWQCTNCQQSFPMAKLAENWWNHKCDNVTVRKDS